MDGRGRFGPEDRGRQTGSGRTSSEPHGGRRGLRAARTGRNGRPEGSLRASGKVGDGSSGNEDRAVLPSAEYINAGFFATRPGPDLASPLGGSRSGSGPLPILPRPLPRQQSPAGQGPSSLPAGQGPSSPPGRSGPVVPPGRSGPVPPPPAGQGPSSPRRGRHRPCPGPELSLSFPALRHRGSRAAAPLTGSGPLLSGSGPAGGASGGDGWDVGGIPRPGLSGAGR
jgi:hypothetical protein